MNMFYTILKILIPLFILSTIETLADTICCPPYCKCSVNNGLKYVNDSEQKLIKLELDIPRSVEWLELSNNFISLLRDNIFQDLSLERIMVLNLNNNAINDVGLNAFKGLQDIKFIDLSGNRLDNVDPATFKNNPSLIYLILSRNPLRNIPSHRPFLISNSLQNLEMSHCGFSDFPVEAFTLLPSLKYLNISNNDILLIHENVFDILKNLRVLDVSNTAIECDWIDLNLGPKVELKLARIIGKPCFPHSLITDRFSYLYEEPLYEKIIKKMIMPDISWEINSSSDEEDYTASECRCPEIVEDFDENSVKTSIEIPERRKSSRYEDRTMRWLVFFYGLIIGASLSISTIVYWIYCCKYRNRSNNTRLPQRPAQCNNIPNETHEIPPLSCTDSQRPAQCNNIPNETPPPSYTDLFMIC